MSLEDSDAKKYWKERPGLLAAVAGVASFFYGLLVLENFAGAILGGVGGSFVCYMCWRPGGFGWSVDAHQRREFEQRGELGVRREFVVRAVVWILLITALLFFLLVLASR